MTETRLPPAESTGGGVIGDPPPNQIWCPECGMWDDHEHDHSKEND